MMELVSLRQAARELRVAERTLRHAVRSGELPAYRLGERTVRVDRLDLKHWVEAKRVSTWQPEGA
jgi:excisionase family DNA binding protein